MRGYCRWWVPCRAPAHQHYGRDSSSPLPCARHGWALPQDSGNGSGTRAANLPHRFWLKSRGGSSGRGELCVALKQATAGKDRQSLSSQRSLVPPAASLGSVPSPVQGREAGWPALGWQHCLPDEELVGGLQSVFLPCQRVGWVHAMSHEAGCRCSALAASVPFPLLQVMLLEQTGQAAWPPTLGTARAKQLCLPPRHTSCKVWGTGAQCCQHSMALGSLIAASSVSPLSAASEQEVHSPALALWDWHRKQLSPPETGLKP